MLVLSRREHEAIVIHHAGEELRVVVWTEDGRIKVGLDSPPTFVALREELTRCPPSLTPSTKG